MKKNKLFWILTVICVLNFAAHLYFYPSLPDIVPTHWRASGQVNGWGPKSTVLILAALPFAMLILFEVIRKIDPKIVKDFLNETVSNFCIKDGLTTSILLKNGIELRFSYKTVE